MAVTNSVRAVLTGPGGLAAGGQMTLKACFLKASSKEVGQFDVISVEVNQSRGSTM